MLSLLLLASACDGSTTEPPGQESTTFRVEQAPAAADTILVRDTLILRLVGPAGGPVAGAQVEFSQQDGGEPLGRLVLDQVDGGGADFTTDSAGRVAVSVFRGPSAGPVWLRFEAPTRGATDSLRLEILPGNPVEIALSPADTAVKVGSSFNLTGLVVDQFGNAREEPVTFQRDSSSLTVSTTLTGATVTGASFGRGTVLVRGAGVERHAWVSVVPDGMLAAHVAAATTADSLLIITTATDGSAVVRRYGSEWRTNRDWQIEWLPGGTELVVSVGFEDHRPDMYRLPLGGDLVPFFASDPGGDADWLPRVGVDNRVYFSFMHDGDGPVEIWRVELDGTSPERIGLAPQDRERDFYPDLSVDGVTLVFTTNRTGSGNDVTRITTMDISATSPTYSDLGVEGSSPTWSPGGDRIAFVDLDGVITVMAPDGTQVRGVSQPGDAYDAWIDWSPDGQWIVGATSDGVAIVNVDSGITLPLPFSKKWRKPAWRPE